MNLTNIKRGQVYKNYKELCKALKIKPKGGDAKQSQIRELRQFVDFTKEGHKFHINKIVENPNLISDKKRRTEYTKEIERLVLDLLVQEKSNGIVLLSKTKLYQTLVMINENYRSCRYRIPKLSAYTNVDEITIKEWYNTTSSLLQRNLETALNSLKKQSLIFWNRQYTLCEVIPKGGKYQINKTIYTDEYGEESVSYSISGNAETVHREATESEIKRILAIERILLDEYNCENKQDIVKMGKWVEFKNRAEEIAFDEMNVAYYYESYKIICNEDHIFNRWQELDKLRLSDIDRHNAQNQLNLEIRKKIIDNAADRNLVAKGEIFDSYGNDCSNPHRASKNYLDDIEVITDTLINNKKRKIIQDVIKINKNDEED